MPGAGPDRRRPRQDPAARTLHRRPRHAPARVDRGHGRDRRAAARRRLLRRHRTDRPRHAPAPRPEHGAHRALGQRADGAGAARLLRRRGPPRALRPALGAAPRLSALRRRRLDADRRPGTGVLPRRAQHRPRHSLAPASRPQRPRRNLAPGLLDRCGQRVRPAVRGRLRLLRADAAQRRHADPRNRRRADGDQLLPRPAAAAGRRGFPLQACGT